MPRKLHIGGKQKAEGWEILNAVPGPDVDHEGNANDLSQFGEATFSAIYASHIVEHLDYIKELAATLKEWYRVLEPGGTIYVSVPDMDVLARMFLDKENNDLKERFFVMRMMFGGHTDEYDYHAVGLNTEFLGSFLHEAGFTDIKKVGDFGLFQDTSRMQYKNIPISTNLIAQKPTDGG